MAVERSAGIRLAGGLLLAFAATAAAAGDRLVTSSPGEPGHPARIAGACPTFSWSAVREAVGYEVVVAELDEASEPGATRLRRRLEGGGIASWTPSLADCLAPGRAYVWTIRALPASAGTESREAALAWAEPRRFFVDGVPSAEEIDAALEVLARARSGVAPRGGSSALPAPSAAGGGRRRAGSRGGSPGLGAGPSSSAIRGETAAGTGAGILGVASGTSGAAWGVYGVTESISGAGVFGQSPAEGGYGVRGENAGSTGAGVFGTMLDTDGYGSGVVGEAHSTSAVGVYARNYATGNPSKAVYGESAGVNSWVINGYATAGSGQNYGVRGDARSSGGYGVLGLSAGVAGGGGTGVGGESQSTGGKGVFARATATTSATYGLWAEVSSTQGTAVRGLARATTGAAHGVFGETDSTQGRAIYGLAPNTTGAYAGYFSGRVQVTGNLSKGGGSFKIDHPLDPENRYLYHSFVESPDMKNVYDGVVSLDGAGSGWVELPEWFEALNRDFRYQLTPIGAPSMVWIGREVSGARFEVRGAPGARVSWQVTGIRKDPYAERHRIPIEERKPDAELGTYLHPEAWGVDPELGLDALERRSIDAPEALPIPVPEALDAPR